MGRGEGEKGRQGERETGRGIEGKEVKPKGTRSRESRGKVLFYYDGGRLWKE